MQASTQGGRSGRGGLTTAAYEHLRQAAETYREVLVVRLCGEVGLRPPEIGRLSPDDFERRATGNGTHHLLAVSAADGDGTARHAYLPPTVRSAVRRYVNEHDIADNERLIDVTPRRIQMIVSEVADRAAEMVGDEDLRTVSSRDLCRYYARQLVHEEGIDPRVVLEVGPWEGLESLSQHLDPVDTDVVLDALERSAVAGPGQGWDHPELGRALDTVDLPVVVLDRDGQVDYANDGFAALTGYARDEVTGRDTSGLYADDQGAVDEGAGPARVRLRRSGGDPVPVHRFAARIPSKHGVSGGEVVVFAEAAGTTADEGRDQAASGRLSTAIEVLGETTEALSAASNRSEVVSAVCERVAAADPYAFTWIGSATRDGSVVSSAWNGIDESTAERLAAVAADARGGGAGLDDDLRVTEVDRSEALQAAVEEAETTPTAIACVPLTYGDTTHGVLGIGTTAEGGIGSEERELLASLGWQVGQALTHIERRNLLLADSVLELEFQTQSEAAFFVAASRQLGASFELQGLVPGENQSLLYFVLVRDTTPDEVVSLADDADSIESARLIRDYGESHLVEFVVAGEEPATTLTELGGQVTEFTVEDGIHAVTAEFTTETDVRAVFNGFQSTFSDSNLTSKQEVERSVQTTEGFRRSLEDDLTDKQQSVLRAAYLAGYFEWPRGSTAEELADSIGVSSPTLHNHLRKAQQKVLTAFFENIDA